MCTKKDPMVTKGTESARSYEEVTLQIIHFTSNDVITSSPDTGIEYPDGWDGAN